MRWSLLIPVSVVALAATASVLLPVASPPAQSAAQQEETRLVPGFTFVAYTGETLPVEEALGDAFSAVAAIWRFDARNEVWEGWSLGLPPSLRPFSDLETGEAYFVSATRNMRWAFVPAQTPAPTRIALFLGDNAVAYTGPTRTIEDAFGGALGALAAIWQFDADTQAWRSWNPSLPLALRDFDTLVHGQAYWIVTSNQISWNLTE